jgi:serine phosphatase RsbU (regulator of sigma subunit)
MIDVYHRQRNIDGVGIFDVSGHGLASGLVTMLVKNIIHQEFYKDTEVDLAEMLGRINSRIIQEKGEIKNYLTGILIRINGSKLELVNAGHPYPIVYKKDLKECFYIERLPGSMGAIGMEDMPTNYQSQFVELNPGDEIILYTDGITDTENELKEVFGKENFIAAIKQNADLPARKQTANIADTLAAFRNSAALKDDITLIILRRKL